jgi:cyclic pyranopterin phosphate synthase
MSISQHLKDGDVQGASEVLAQVLRDKPKENRWNDYNPNAEDVSNRAFYQTGG